MQSVCRYMLVHENPPNKLPLLCKMNCFMQRASGLFFFFFSADAFENVYEEYLPDKAEEGTSMTAPHSAANSSNSRESSSKVDGSPTSDYFKGLGTATEPLANSRSGWTGDAEDVSSEFSEASDYQVPDEQRFREAPVLARQQSEEFPLGSYRSQPRPPLLDHRQAYNSHLVGPVVHPHGHTPFDNPFRPNLPSKGAETTPHGVDGDVDGKDMISLNLAGITAAGGGGNSGDHSLEDSFGVSGVSNAFLPYSHKSELEQNGSNGGNWNQSVEQPKTSDKLWSRVVGGGKGVEKSSGKPDTPSLDGFSDSTSFNTSYAMDDDDVIHLRPCEEFVHQSQVENDTFQPYHAAPNLSPLMPAMLHKERDMGDSIEGKWTEEDEASVAPDVNFMKMSGGESKSPLPVGHPGRRRELFSDDSNNNNSKLPGVSMAPGPMNLAPGAGVSLAPGVGLAPGTSLAVGGGGNPWSGSGTTNGMNGGGVWGASVATDIHPGSLVAPKTNMLASAVAASSNLDEVVGGVGRKTFSEVLQPLSTGPPAPLNNPSDPHHELLNSYHPPTSGGVVTSNKGS